LEPVLSGVEGTADVFFIKRRSIARDGGGLTQLHRDKTFRQIIAQGGPILGVAAQSRTRQTDLHRFEGLHRALRIDVEGSLLAVNVDDAGSGVPGDEHEQVFERFFRGRAAHDRGIARGTGLGLALVADHVRAFGGTITVAESPEGGARFQILLPIITSEHS